MTTVAPPKHIAAILDKLTSKGFKAYIVGGSVRDAMLSRSSYDWDIATSATPADVVRLFEKTVLTGEKFGTVTVVLDECTVEVTTFRTDGEYNDARHPQSVEFVTDINKDLGRRDFTINAIAMSIDGEIVDPFGGINDINEKIIRCVGDPEKRFSEDALRMFRAFRFSAQLGFKIEKDTLSAIKAGAANAANISAERIQAELGKTLMSKKPEIVGEIIKSGLLNRFLQGAYKNSVELCRMSKLPDETALRWGVLCAVLFDEKCIESAWDFLRELHVESKIIKTINTAMLVKDFPTDRIGQKRMLVKYGASAARVAAAINDVKTGDSMASLLTIYRIMASGECISLDTLAVTGKDLIELGLSPGPELGKELYKLLDYVIVNPDSNNREVLLKFINNK
ncbi:MAG: CCA tRNA nucleotidyltransferase [Oscillospiraceae bacterium]|nr:CCA tRNA nucleotidyltransferase [Oscillospiraceae bacterium]